MNSCVKYTQCMVPAGYQVTAHPVTEDTYLLRTSFREPFLAKYITMGHLILKDTFLGSRGVIKVEGPLYIYIAVDASTGIFNV